LDAEPEHKGDAAGTWGGSCSYILGRDGSLGAVLDDDQQPTYGAGFGGPGSTFAIDEYGIAYEWCQSQAQEPFTPQQYERGAREIAAKCHKYGIPPGMIEIPVQSGTVPAGIVRHDRCQNGYVLGKSDPGSAFDEKLFIGLVKIELAKLEEEDMGIEFSSSVNFGNEGPGLPKEAVALADLLARYRRDIYAIRAEVASLKALGGSGPLVAKFPGATVQVPPMDVPVEEA